MPTEVGLPSVNARAGPWHVAQATVPSPESRLSKNNFLPTATVAGVSGLAGDHRCGERRGKADLIL